MCFIIAIQFYVRASLGPVLPQVLINFWHRCFTCKCGKLYLRRDACKKAPHSVYLRYLQFTCKIGKFTCFYAATTWRRIHSIAFNETRKSRVISPAGCWLIYLQFTGVIAMWSQIACNCGYFCVRLLVFCLQLRVFLCAIAGFLSAIAGIFPFKSRHFFMPFQANLHEFRM